MRWYNAYLDLNRIGRFRSDGLCENEHSLIVYRTVGDREPGGHVAQFSAAVRIKRLGKADVSRAFGRSNLTRIMSALEQVDAIASACAGIPASRVLLHAGLYGPDEFAHCPTNERPGYVSVNFGCARVRHILRGVLRKDHLAICAAVSLMLHEKAHLAMPTGLTGHGPEFYAVKDRLNRAFVARICENKNRDPFRRSRFADDSLPCPGDVAARLPGYVEATP